MQLRERAILLRLEGKSYREISESLGVSKSTLSGWLGTVPLSPEHQLQLAERQLDGAAVRGLSVKAAAEARRSRLRNLGESQISHLSERDLFIAGVVAYWCEGTKSKPWGKSSQLRFVNSDPGLITLFLSWLNLLGVRREDLKVRLAIHETSDIAAATLFWSEVVGLPPGSFLKPTVKRHRPRTIRRNRFVGYHGCLSVGVAKSSELGHQIEGWFKGIVRGISQF